MKLVQMPIDLIHIEPESLPARGVHPELLRQFERYRARAPDAAESLAIFGPPGSGTRELLMVLARQVGAALRDENIALRDHGGDLGAGRKKLCYLPGAALADALRTPSARRTLEREAACFLQDLDEAWRPDGSELASSALLDLLDLRLAADRTTFLSADPAGLPDGLAQQLRARLSVIEATC